MTGDYIGALLAIYTTGFVVYVAQSLLRLHQHKITPTGRKMFRIVGLCFLWPIYLASQLDGQNQNTWLADRCTVVDKEVGNE